MERKKMKRVNVIIEADLYQKARVIAFVRGQSISEIFRTALGTWLSLHLDEKAELVLTETDERKLIKILTTDEFIPAENAKKKLGL